MFEPAFAWEIEKTRRPWTVAVGFTCQVALVALAILIPLVSPDALPGVRWTPFWFVPSPPPGPAVKLVPVDPRVAAGSLRSVPFDQAKLTQPGAVPDKVALIVDDETGLPPSLGAGYGPGVPDGIEGGSRVVVPPPPEPVKPAKHVESAPPAPAEPIRVGGQVQAARLIRQVIPAYPPLARQARVSGVVRLLGIVGADGRIRQLDVIQGHPLLVGAALEAVRQWSYQPTLLNGVPVEVMAPIDVIFKLSQ